MHLLYRFLKYKCVPILTLWKYQSITTISIRQYASFCRLIICFQYNLYYIWREVVNATLTQCIFVGIKRSILVNNKLFAKLYITILNIWLFKSALIRNTILTFIKCILMKLSINDSNLNYYMKYINSLVQSIQ